MSNSIRLLKHECYGCTACMLSCSAKAITMKADKEGFTYPWINEKICTGCGLCERICQSKNIRKYEKPLALYAAKNRDQENRLHSSSGGIFSLLASYIEDMNGVIYGAEFDEKFLVRHKRAEKREEWERFKQSKYVQSDLRECYVSVKQDLERGIPVLFTGTPCQIEGLNRFVAGINTDKLLTCDVLCHGVPSPKIWKEWLDIVEKNSGHQISNISFRDKQSTGWHQSSLTIMGDDGNVVLTGTHNQNSFSKMYFRHLISRPSCYHCRYASWNRPSDITLGDYWGIEKKFAYFDDDKGVSLIICSTEKGHKVWKSVCDSMDFFPVDQSQCEQPSLVHATEESKDRKIFWSIYSRFGLNAVMKYFRLMPLSRFESVVVRAAHLFVRIKNNLLYSSIKRDSF